MKRLVMFLFCVALCAAWSVAMAAPKAPAAASKLAYLPSKVVQMKHETHAKVDCKACHHEPDFGKTDAVKKCSDKGCHDSLDKADKTEKSLYQAFHKKGGKHASCLSCHTDEAGKMDKEKGKAMKGCNKSVCHP